MVDILFQLLPFFILIIMGALSVRFLLLDEPGIKGLNCFVYFYALPALLFKKIAEASFTQILSEFRFLFAYIFVGLLMFLFIWMGSKVLFHKDRAHCAVLGLASCYGNIGFLGIPVFVNLLGGWVAVPLSIMLLVDIVLFIPLTVFLLQVFKGDARSSSLLLSSLVSVVKNPLIIAVIFGLLFSANGWGVPDAIAGVTSLLGQTAGPTAMFALGAVLGGRPISKGFGEAFAISFIKLLVYPALVWVVMSWFGIGAEWRLAATLGAATPIAAALFVIAQEHNAMPSRASTAVVLSTALALMTLPLLIYWLG